MKSYTIRLFPDKNNIKDMKELSLIRNNLWNKLIDLQKESFNNDNKIRHNYDLDKEITKLRKEKTFNVNKLNSKACQRISKEVFTSYKSFFQLYKKDKSARPPGFIQNINDFHTIVFNQSGWFIKDDFITINKIKMRIKSHLNITKLNIKEIKIKFKNNKWLCDILVDEKIIYDETITKSNKVLSIDLGLKKLGTGVDNKGEQVIILNKTKKINKYYEKQIANVNKKMSTKTKGSNKYNKLKETRKKLFNKKNKQIKQTLHTQSKQLLSMNYHTIVLGKLTVKRLMENEKNKYSKVSKSFHHTNINMFKEMLKYKSYLYKTNIVEVDEKYTTQTNCLTGELFKNKIELNDRTVILNNNIEIERDLNSAINIMKRYFKNHIVSMTEPLDISNVVNNFNIINKTLNKKPNLL